MHRPFKFLFWLYFCFDENKCTEKSPETRHLSQVGEELCLCVRIIPS